jgi:peptidoglycan/xylan/chitin deacetylase (PgdA/CDA1 family)
MNEPMKTIYTCFPGGKHKALTMSYDDGQIHDRRLIEIFNKYGIKGTFHLNSGIMEKDEKRVKPEEARELYAGHEVACHTYTHPTIERCPIEQTVRQIIKDREILEELVGYPVRGLSYPNGSYNDEIKAALPACGIEYSRVVGNTDDFALPRDLYEWTSTCHHSHNLMQNAERFAALDKKQYLYLMYVWGHSYEFPRDNIWGLIEEFCSFIGGRDDIWYAANIEIVDYMNAAKQLKYTVCGDMVYNPSASDVWISVDGKICEIGGGQTVKI